MVPEKASRRQARPTGIRIVSCQADALINELPAEAWHRVAWRGGTKGPLVKEFALIEVFCSGHRGEHLPVRALLLGEQPIGKANQTEKQKYYFTWGLSELPPAELVDLTQIRWVIERFYQDAKGELGLDRSSHFRGPAHDGPPSDLSIGKSLQYSTSERVPLRSVARPREGFPLHSAARPRGV